MVQGNSVLRHVVLFKFNEHATQKAIENIVNEFRSLPQKIDEIIDFEWGTDVSVENLEQGLTHCFIVSFRNADDRDKYLPHPAHERFKEILKPNLEKAVVFDFYVDQ